MVEKEAAAAVRAVIRLGAAARRAIGLTALQVRPDRCRREREAVLHRLRLKADILKLASAAPRRPQCSSEEVKGVSYACCMAELLAFVKIKAVELLPLVLSNGSGLGQAVHNRGRESSSEVMSCRRATSPPGPELDARESFLCTIWALQKLSTVGQNRPERQPYRSRQTSSTASLLQNFPAPPTTAGHMLGLTCPLPRYMGTPWSPFAIYHCLLRSIPTPSIRLPFIACTQTASASSIAN
jgi:hypothetical protein